MPEAGRPTIMTPEIISKLENVFAMGGTDEEACFYAGIGKSALYNFQEKNPEFVERKEGLKLKPVLKARQTIINSLDNPNEAKWYLEKKTKEFKNRFDLTSEDEKIENTTLNILKNIHDELSNSNKDGKRTD